MTAVSTEFPPSQGQVSSRRPPSQVNWGDRAFKVTTAGFAILIIVTIAAMALEMLTASKLSLREFGWRFLTSTDWNPVGRGQEAPTELTQAELRRCQHLER